jgi:hypothetical protein
MTARVIGEEGLSDDAYRKRLYRHFLGDDAYRKRLYRHFLGDDAALYRHFVIKLKPIAIKVNPIAMFQLPSPLIGRLVLT